MQITSNTGQLTPSSSLVCKNPPFMDLWEEVRFGCNRVLNDPQDPMCRNLHPLYSKVYRLASNACQRVPALVRGSANERVTTRDNIAQQCLVLYYLLRELLKDHLERSVIPKLEAVKSKFFEDKSLIKVQPTRDAIDKLVKCKARGYGLELPDLYVELWTRYSVSVSKLCVVFAYLQSTWHNLTIQQSNSSPFNVLLVASSLWNDHVLGPIKEIMGLILVGIVSRDRVANTTIPEDDCPNGELIALRRVLTALLELNPHPTRPHIAYQDTFEFYLFENDTTFFLAEAEKKYPLSKTNVDTNWNGDIEAAKRDLPNKLPVYLKIVQNWMNTELHRALSYMHRITAVAIRQRILDRMLLNNRQEVIESSITWLRTAASSNIESMRKSRHIIMTNTSAVGIDANTPTPQCHDLSLLCDLLKDSDSTNSAIRELGSKFSQFVYQEGINSAFNLIADPHHREKELKGYTPCSDDDLVYYSKLTAVQKKELLKTPESKKKQISLTRDPSMLMAALLDEYGKYSALVHVVFQKNPVMTKALDDGITRFLNENDVVGFSPVDDGGSKLPSSNAATHRSAQLLARYFHDLICEPCDGMGIPAARIHSNSYLLSPNVTNDSAPFGEAYEANTHLAISFFSLLRDRDAFQLSYQTLLMNRLIYTSIARARALWDEEREMGHLPSFGEIAEVILNKERDIIDRLKDKTSVDYVHRWILMVNEAEQFIIASLDSMARGSQHNTVIAGQQLWPISMQSRSLANPPGTHVDCITESNEFPFPGELQTDLLKGHELYSATNKKKISRWAPALSFGDIIFLNTDGDSIELTVSYTQMMLLRAFEKIPKKFLTFSDLYYGFKTCPSCVRNHSDRSYVPSNEETTEIAKALSPMVKEGIVRINSINSQKLFNKGLLPLDKFSIEYFELCLDSYQPPSYAKTDSKTYKVDIYLKYLLFPASVDLPGAPVVTQDMSLRTVGSYFPGTTEGLLESSRAETQVLGKSRKESLEAVVISILKTESSSDGTMSYEELYPKVNTRFAQCVLDFSFSIHDIKAAVNSLISKSYIEVSLFDSNRLSFLR